jgi:excisionase family DNA binding protein
MKNKPKTFLTRRQLCDRWQVSGMTLQRREKSGELPAYKLGRGTRYLLEDVEAVEAAARVTR